MIELDPTRYANPKRKQFRWVGVMREQWLSICSAHRDIDKNCNTCAVGRWENMVQMRAEAHWADQDPAGYLAWVNRPESAVRKSLEHIFPGLRNEESDNDTTRIAKDHHGIITEDSSFGRRHET